MRKSIEKEKECKFKKGISPFPPAHYHFQPSSPTQARALSFPPSLTDAWAPRVSRSFSPFSAHLCPHWTPPCHAAHASRVALRSTPRLFPFSPLAHSISSFPLCKFLSRSRCHVWKVGHILDSLDDR